MNGHDSGRLPRTEGGPRPLKAAQVLLAAACFCSGGCGYSGGKVLYMLGLGREKVVKAEFRLTDEPLLILVDDFDERVSWPAAKRYLADELTQQLIRQGAAKNIIPQRTLMELRQSDPGFDKRGCREVGRLVDAEQVLWLQVRDFLAREGITDPSSAAYLAVSVKVINAKETENRRRVRLWPDSVEGRYVAVQLGGDQVVRLGSSDAISRMLAKDLALKIAKFFHDYHPDAFETAP